MRYTEVLILATLSSAMCSCGSSSGTAKKDLPTEQERAVEMVRDGVLAPTEQEQLLEQVRDGVPAAPEGCGKTSKGKPALFVNVPAYANGPQIISVTLQCDGYPPTLPQTSYKLMQPVGSLGHQDPNYPRDYRFLDDWIDEQKIIYIVRVMSHDGSEVAEFPVFELQPDQTLLGHLEKRQYRPTSRLVCTHP